MVLKVVKSFIAWI